MTTLGHIIIGGSIGLLSVPRTKMMWRHLIIIIAIIAIANIPDWPLPGWGQHRLAYSHSLFVNMVVLGCIAMIWIRGAGLVVARRHAMIMTGAILAWLSHFLLDMLYGDSGVAILWPFSSAKLSLPVPWLHTMPHVPPPFDPVISKIFLMELLTFSPFLIAAMLIRKKKSVVK